MKKLYSVLIFVYYRWRVVANNRRSYKQKWLLSSLRETSFPGVTISIRYALSVMTLLLLLMTTNTFAVEPLEDKSRAGYSFFGLGYEILDYEENTAPVIDGKSIDVETATIVNLTQQSGAYVAINHDWGFYLATASTLGETISNEEWQIDGVTVRTNNVSIVRARVGFLASRRISSTGFLLFGAQYGKTEFKRFAANLTPEAGDFGIDENTFSDGTVSESVWNYSLVAGYESNTLFISKLPGWRHQFQLIAGVPLITNISNTEVNEGASFSESFNGFHIRASGIYGYQFNENFMAAFGLEMGVSQRNAISQDFEDSEGATEFPESNIVYFYPALVAMWSF